MPKILVGWNLAIYKLPRFNVFGSEWAMFGAYQKKTRRQYSPVGSRRVDAYLSVGPKTLFRPRAVKTDRKSFVFSFFRVTKSISVRGRTISSLRAFEVFRFFALRSLDHKFWCLICFLRFQAVTRTLFFPKLQVDFRSCFFLFST